MARLRPIIRYVLLTATSGTLIAVVYAVVGEFFVSWARENGWYDAPTQRIERTVAAVADFISQPWFSMTTSLLIGLTIGSWLDHSLRKRLPGVQAKTSPIDVNANPDLYTYDPAYQLQDSSAYYELMEFALNHVVPTCEQRILFQETIIFGASKDETIARFAIDGMRANPDKSTRAFWMHYATLLNGIDSSEPTIKFEALMDCIDGLERGNYRSFCAQSDELMRSAGFSLRSDVILRQIWDDWREKHNALIKAYESIKRNARYEKLFRPLKDSRWGDRIEPLGPF